MPDIASLRPARKVYLGLDAQQSDPVAGIVWTQVPADHVVSVSLDWGAQHELATIEPTKITVTFDNSDGSFEPLNPASPYYPKLRPMNRIRIVDTWAGVDTIRCTLFVTQWPRSWSGFSRATVTIDAFDALGAVFAVEDIANHPWEMAVRRLIEEVPSTGQAVWLRLDESGSTTVAADSSGYALDGVYQGGPTLGVPGLIAGDSDKAFQPALGGVVPQRAFLPHKALITGYPCFFHASFRLAPDRGKQKVFFFAADGPSGAPGQFVEIFVDSNFGLPQPGKVVAIVAKGSVKRRVYSSITVDASNTHQLDVAFYSATDFRIFIDGTDYTVVDVAGAPDWPLDLNTGWGIGNTPDVAYGDFAFVSTPATDVLDEALILSGYAPTPSEIQGLAFASLQALIPNTSGNQLIALLASMGWPLSDASVNQGASVVQSGYVAGKALAYAQKLDLTEGGRLFVDGAGVVTFHDRHRIFQPPYTVSQATFGEGTGEIGYVPVLNYGEDDQDIWNDVPVANAGGKLEVQRDKASAKLYGHRTLSGLTDLLGTSDADSIGRGQRDLALYKDPVTRIREITIEPQNEDTSVAWPALLGLGQASRVTLKATPPGTSLFTQPSHVEHFHEEMDAAKWTITLRLSAAETQDFGIWDTSEWGSAAWSY